MYEWNDCDGRLVGVGPGYGLVCKWGSRAGMELCRAPRSRNLDHYRYRHADVGGTPATAQATVQANAAAVAVAPSGGNICAAYGFSKTIRSTWDWASNSGHRIDTYVTSDTDGGMGLGTNGILVVDFVPTGPSDSIPNLALVSATGFPAPNMTNVLTVAISTSPCTLYADSPGSATDTSPTVPFGVGAVPHYWASGTRNGGVSHARSALLHQRGRARRMSTPIRRMEPQHAFRGGPTIPIATFDWSSQSLPGTDASAGFPLGPCFGWGPFVWGGADRAA